MKRHPSAPPSQSVASSEVVPLGIEIESPPPSPPPSRPGGLHGTGIAGMTFFAFVGIVSMFALISVRWPQDTSRVVVVVLVGSIVGFLVCASIAVSAAMRDTYARADAETFSTSSKAGERPE